MITRVLMALVLVCLSPLPGPCAELTNHLPTCDFSVNDNLSVWMNVLVLPGAPLGDRDYLLVDDTPRMEWVAHQLRKIRPWKVASAYRAEQAARSLGFALSGTLNAEQMSRLLDALECDGLILFENEYPQMAKIWTVKANLTLVRAAGLERIGACHGKAFIMLWHRMETYGIDALDNAVASLGQEFRDTAGAHEPRQ